MQSPQIRPKSHAVNVYDGVVGRLLRCSRCRRRLPEAQFARIETTYIKRGRVVAYLHPNCHTCRKQAKGKWIKHPEYSPELDRFWNDRLSGLKGGAGVRGLIVSIEKDDLLGMYLEQDGRCAISGLKMDPFKTGVSVGKSGRSFSVPSVDRIDSKGHYTLDNIQIVLQAVNTMKGELPQGVFLELCGLISDKHRF